ncbi:flagellar hook assembly protein FlgD [Azospirillum doebereinerae]|uniref:Basal-body rod modification protein FlgD n=1 Tax=Azospirillum doebereinerae TaxID=92933 RepID=A0A3S0V613_9PROT|nr:flagellar hook capping FlgD N-terminal domain-containing protein [Azospirillum doebereinerae]MCG5239871.1 flagellar hook assembly protein FlgD [Azospirillum doebereinerae]RUQ70704.1 flagellar hook assembly protein FlgD [Azospirillum doebereinerae]
MATTTDSTGLTLNQYGTYAGTKSTGSKTVSKNTPTTDEGKTASATKGLGDNFETFLTMLTTQMKNQDPLKPMDTNEMTKQLVEFANVEQNIGTNSRLDKLVKLQGAGTASTNLAYLGRTVSYEGDSFQYTQGMTQAPLGYQLETAAKSVRVDILDGQGRLVRSMTGETSAGTKHAVTWDFKDDSGNAVQPGTYRMNVAPTSAEKDATIKTTSYTFGTVGGIGSNKDGETVLTIGTSEVPLSSLTTVY